MNTTRDNNGTKTYRGRTLEEILPRIKSELGPEAVIVRQRDGLMGGVGGFFQRPCIEVDARAAEAEPQTPAPRRFDAYDDGEAIVPSAETFVPEPIPTDDEATAEGLASPAIQEMLRQAAPFAEHLSAAEETQPPEHPGLRSPVSGLRSYAPLPAPARGRPPAADGVEASLVSAGLRPELAAQLVAETVSHRLPFSSPRSLKRLVRDALAARIPVEPAAHGRGRSLAIVGPGGAGKTLATARLAAAYASGSDLPVVCLALRSPDGGAELGGLLEPHGVGVQAVDSGAEARAHVAGALSHALIVVDTPAVAPGSPAEIAALADELRTLGLDEIHLAVPATFSGPAAEELIERLAPLGATRVVLTHMDATSRIGSLLDFLVGARTPISYTSTSSELEPADAGALAATVLP